MMTTKGDSFKINSLATLSYDDKKNIVQNQLARYTDIIESITGESYFKMMLAKLAGHIELIWL